MERKKHNQGFGKIIEIVDDKVIFYSEKYFNFLYSMCGEQKREEMLLSLKQ